MTLPTGAYFSMEMALVQSLHTYAGGLGFLAGSHMCSAREMDMPMVGVSSLWRKGYGEQCGNDREEAEVFFTGEYPFLEDAVSIQG